MTTSYGENESDLSIDLATYVLNSSSDVLLILRYLLLANCAMLICKLELLVPPSSSRLVMVALLAANLSNVALLSLPSPQDAHSVFTSRDLQFRSANPGR